MSRRKAFWKMSTDELAAATKEFDDPNYDPPVVKPSIAQKTQLRNWQRKVRQRSKLTLLLERDLIALTDDYAVNHGITFSEVVSDALRKLMRKKSA
jgi:hypothetical protein